MGANQENLRWSGLLGWSPEEIGLPDGTPVDDVTVVRKVTTLQGIHGIREDGIWGPETYRHILDDRLAGLDNVWPSTKPGYDSEWAGVYAVTRAKRLWLEDVEDPPTSSPKHNNSRAVIDRIIRTSLGWTWEPPYVKDGDYEWCGGFVAHAYEPMVPLPTRKTFFSSTYRLDRFARGLDVNGVRSPLKKGRMVVLLDESADYNDDVRFPDGSSPQPGDILLVGGARSGYGSHVTLVESYSPGLGFSTIEGNATGPDPYGNRQHGIVRTWRPLGLKPTEPRTRYHARRLIRLGYPGDYATGGEG